MQAVANTKSAKPKKAKKEVVMAAKPVQEIDAPVKKAKGPSQPPRKPSLAKGIKVPRAVKAMAALMYPTDRTTERGVIRSLAQSLHANEQIAKTRGKDKKEA